MIPHWERCAGWLQAALDHAGEHTLEHVHDECLNGRAILWPGERCAIVTHVIDRELHCWLGGGDLRELLTLRPGIEAWGRAAGCTHATLKGRTGWARLFASFGYAPSDGEMRKPL